MREAILNCLREKLFKVSKGSNVIKLKGTLHSGGRGCPPGFRENTSHTTVKKTVRTLRNMSVYNFNFFCIYLFQRKVHLPTLDILSMYSSMSSSSIRIFIFFKLLKITSTIARLTVTGRNISYNLEEDNVFDFMIWMDDSPCD
eukprot:GHVR01136464.1.p1 GENE.GHVR01136464.1~~GHVR01136464.1.p1  ORF type:complete len:143 (+),score=6.95 GHVR01136464.1:126-554(+)